MILDKINIVCTIDNNYVTHCGVMLKSLFLNNKRYIFNVYIFYNNISINNLNKLTDFITIEGHNSNPILVDESLIGNAPISHHVSLATYYRLLIPQYIDKDIDRILFLDSDLIVRKDISELWKVDLEKFALAACLEHVGKEHLLKLGLEDNSDYFNAGVLLINVKLWCKEEVSNRALNFIKKNVTRIKYWDQDALNAVLANSWLNLNPKWNVGNAFFNDKAFLLSNAFSKDEIANLKSDPAIVHFSGSEKPWHLNNKHPFKLEYIFYKSKTPWKNENLQGIEIDVTLDKKYNINTTAISIKNKINRLVSRIFK